MPLPAFRAPHGLLIAGLALLVAAGAAAQPQGAGAPHATRAGQALGELEDQLLQAMRGRDAARLDALLDVDFEMIVAQAPTQPVPREDWIGTVLKRGAADWAMQGLSARDAGEAAVAGFVLRSAGGHGPALYVVDTWQRRSGGWRLLVRHVALASGPRTGIPGDARTPVAIKKF